MTGKNLGKALKDGSEVAETADVAPHQENDRRGSVGLHAVDCMEVVVIADNYYDSSRPDVHVAKRYRSTPGKAIHVNMVFPVTWRPKSEAKPTASCLISAWIPAMSFITWICLR